MTTATGFPLESGSDRRVEDITPPLARAICAVVLGGLFAGALDLAYAFTFYSARGVPPLRILQSIASGIFGQEAYRGGIEFGIVGAALHFSMAVVMAAVFVMSSAKFPLLLRSPLTSGVAYGLGLFVVMNYVVVPLSAAFPGTRPTGWLYAGSVFAHTALVGVPIALITKWLFAADKPALAPSREKTSH
jgi:uncharacterized membrane protein YagU involved in acid resistance